MDAKLLREKAVEQQLAAGTKLADIPVKAAADVNAVLAYIEGKPLVPPPEVKQ